MGPNKLIVCAGKERLDPSVARMIVRRDVRGHRRRDGHDRERDGRAPYKCRYCGGWHLGSPVPRDKGKTERRDRRERRERDMALAADLVAAESYVFEPA